MAFIVVMRKSSIIGVFVGLFLFMILDLILKFPLIVRSSFYGGSFIVGTAILYFNYYKPRISEKQKSK